MVAASMVIMNSNGADQIVWIQNMRANGPWIAHLNPCQEERMFTTKYKSHSSTLKAILGITRIITEAYQIKKGSKDQESSITKFNHIILVCTISMSDLFTQPKRSGVCIRSKILIA